MSFGIYNFKLYHCPIGKYLTPLQLDVLQSTPISDMINDADLDGNKVLDFEEFLVMMEKKVSFYNEFHMGI